MIQDATALHDAARTLLHEHAAVEAEARGRLHEVQARAARDELAAIPVARLKDVTGGRLRLGALEQAGFTTVAAVLDAPPYRLELVPGIGRHTARQVHAAAKQIAEAATASAPVRIEIERRRDPALTALVVALHRLVAAGPELPRGLELARRLEQRLAPLLHEAGPARSRLRLFFTLPARRRRALAAVEELEHVLARNSGTRLLLTELTTDLMRPPVHEIEAWSDFEHRAAEYYALLGELTGEPLTGGAGALSGDLLAKVEAQPLDDTHRRVSLRGYQAFGARFALAQRRVIIGDEMGLGKSVEAIAVLAHLRATEATHFLVVCPTSVLINWVREIESRSSLRAFPLHGDERAAVQAEWVRQGGVAIVTLDSLWRLEVPPELPVGLLVVDEAHYAKNPATRRSRSVHAWCRRVERVLFLTGTPMENRVEEFRTLIGYLQPPLAESLRGSDVVAGAQAFRKAVAPVYLRRNQEEVLTELPERVDADEWVEFSGPDLEAYREAVASGNFMAMRRAAYRTPATSAKLKRLTELVEEAKANQLKVVVFSFFHDVLHAVGEALDGFEYGPISGDVPAARRQQLVDSFGAEPGHAVLLAQVQAGGVGLNLQAASVVILCEPQLKPSVEAQAVARAHRMGQVRRVQTHRLLAADSVDQRLLAILGGKSRLFDAFARRSDLAESSPHAVDVSEQDLARQIVEEEQIRLATRPG
ncbi:DEAD/DEAH box helicase [Nonomuraea sp. NPDC050310]|uniref:DEAD/DEAH box helicase n=1 Tax=Nonomuraea sp. NPDC050310 TaxID=3154935 RepID=UPI0033EB48C1